MTYETRADLPIAPRSTGRRGGSKYDAYVDQVLAAAGRQPDGTAILTTPDPENPMHVAGAVAHPDLYGQPHWVKYDRLFEDRQAAYALGGNIAGVLKRRPPPPANGLNPHDEQDMRLSVTVLAESITTPEGESSLRYALWMRFHVGP